MTSTLDTPRGKRHIESPLFATLRSLAGRGLRHFGKSRSSRRLQLVETLPLGGKRQLMLILCDGQHFLIGAGSDAVSSIMPVPVAACAATDAPENLSDAIQHNMNNGSFLQ
jgi:flagellar biogenesis protein FliO